MARIPDSGRSRESFTQTRLRCNLRGGSRVVTSALNDTPLSSRRPFWVAIDLDTPAPPEEKRP